MKILVLGHKGMLGNMVYKYLSTKNDCELFTTDLRWPTKEFKKFVIDFCEDEYTKELQILMSTLIYQYG